MNKKILLTILIVLLLSVYSFSLLVITSDKIEMKYLLLVEGNNNYELKIPYPNFPHDNINEMKINHTQHGKVYEFVGNNVSKININSKKVSFLFYHFPEKYFELSTIDLRSGRYVDGWLFSNENITISFSVTLSEYNVNSGHKIIINYTGVLTPGWNLLKMTKREIFIDSFGQICCLCIFFNIIVTVIFIVYIKRLFKRI